MGSARELEVYKLGYVHTREIFKLTRKFPKDVKNSLGQQFFNSAVSLLSKILLANRSKEKMNEIENAISEVDLMFTYARLSVDLKVISTGEYQMVSDRLAEILSQLNAWAVWSRKNLVENAVSQRLTL